MGRHTVRSVMLSSPETWANGTTPLEREAKAFLDEVRGDRLNTYAQLLIDAGWQVPVYPGALNIWPDLPVIHTHSLASPDALPALGRGKKISGRRVILNLQQPIQVDPDPVEVGCGPVWAEEAPIRADASVRPKFWAGRQYLWRHTLRKMTVEDGSLIHSFKDGLLVTRHGNIPLKIETALKPQSTAYRLKFNGKLVADNTLKVRRGKLSGLYVTEDDGGQTDLIFVLTDPAAPLKGFLLNHLRDSLIARGGGGGGGGAQVLIRCARLAERMEKILAPSPSIEETVEADRPAVTSYTLEEARRGFERSGYCPAKSNGFHQRLVRWLCHNFGQRTSRGNSAAGRQSRCYQSRSV